MLIKREIKKQGFEDVETFAETDGKPAQKQEVKEAIRDYRSQMTGGKILLSMS